MCRHDQPDLILAIAQETLLWLPILAQISENWHTPPSFYALALHNVWGYRNVDAPINTADNPSTSDDILVNFVSVTHEFCRRGLPAGLGYAFRVC